jgi:hypothetical protein
VRPIWLCDETVFCFLFLLRQVVARPWGLNGELDRLSCPGLCEDSSFRRLGNFGVAARFLFEPWEWAMTPPVTFSLAGAPETPLLADANLIPGKLPALATHLRFRDPLFPVSAPRNGRWSSFGRVAENEPGSMGFTPASQT